jgi:Holliday junction DNA helicase RuvA
MIAHLRGKLIFKEPGQAIVEAGGVGYDVTISVPTFTALPSVGAEAALHIHTQVSEDQIALFGFLDREEKRLFERLITVSGVGPKLAIKILSGLSTERTVQAIRGQDHAQLVAHSRRRQEAGRAPRGGAERQAGRFAAPPVQPSVQGPAAEDVLSALVNLGYQRPAAEKAIAQAVAKDASAGRGFRRAFPRSAEADPINCVAYDTRLKIHRQEILIAAPDCPPLPYLRPEGLKFLRGLAKHNDREWFNERKAIYEAELKEPMLAIVRKVTDAMTSFAPDHVRPAEKSLFRIYRDTRFSHDKRPYKTHVAAWWSHMGMEKTSGAGYYFQMSPSGVVIAAGAYMPEKEQLAAIRHWMLENHVAFRKVLQQAGGQEDIQRI